MEGAENVILFIIREMTFRIFFENIDRANQLLELVKVSITPKCFENIEKSHLVDVGLHSTKDGCKDKAISFRT